MTVEGITVDVCKGGCAGIWFDRYELMKVDESHESAGEELSNIEGDPAVLSTIDHTKRLSCPKTPEVVMMRHFFSVNWLDVGELATIRTEFATEEERDQAAAQYFSELFDSELIAAHSETLEDLESAQRIAYIFRFICPSYYIPGKQEWGAF